MNFGEIKTEIFNALGESESSPVHFLEAEIEDAIHDGYEQISDVAEWYEVSQSINLTADYLYYDLQSLLTRPPLYIDRVWNDQQSRWLDRTSVGRLDRTHRTWQRSIGEPQHFFMRGAWNMGVYPHVDATSGTLTVYYKGMPARFSADGDVAGFHQEFHRGIIEYALFDLLSQDRESGRAIFHYERYLRYEQKLKTFVRSHGTRLRRAALGGG